MADLAIVVLDRLLRRRTDWAANRTLQSNGRQRFRHRQAIF
jgi:hypothetical protein